MPPVAVMVWEYNLPWVAVARAVPVAGEEMARTVGTFIVWEPLTIETGTTLLFTEAETPVNIAV